MGLRCLGSGWLHSGPANCLANQVPLLPGKQEHNLPGVALQEAGDRVGVVGGDVVEGGIEEEGLIVHPTKADAQLLHLDVEAFAEAGEGDDVGKG